MVYQNPWKAGRLWLSLLGQLIILIFCFGYIEFMYYSTIAPDKEAKESFRLTRCAIVEKHLMTSGHFLHHYRADFLLSYHVAGAQYQAWATGNGLDSSYSTNRGEQQAILDKYVQGQAYDCWYNPAVPHIVVLERRHHWFSTFPLVIPVVIAVVVLCYLLKTIMLLVGRLCKH